MNNPQQDLHITLVQSSLHWQSVDANLAMFEEKLWQINTPTDIIILPEMFNTGFSMQSHVLAEPMNFRTFRWMRQMAAQKKAVITGSFIVKEKGHYFNRLIWMQPDGQYRYYDKRHLFRMANEHEYFSPGTSRIICEWKGWRICPLVCYDLRFPVWSRNTHSDVKEPVYDVLIYVANWPAARVNAWDALLNARAIENLAYVIGINRTGEDDNGILYNGHSGAYDGRGQKLAFLNESETIVQISLSAKDIISLREKFPAFLDADDFAIN